MTNFLEKHARRKVGLDILRGLAILYVVFIHSMPLLPKRYHTDYVNIGIDPMSAFFVLSGFLIGKILLRMMSTMKLDRQLLLTFWVGRWFKTMPNYMLILTLVLGLQVFLKMDVSGFNLSYYVFSQNLLTVHPLFFGELWSMSVEEWFYLLLPLSCMVLYPFFTNKRKIILVVSIFFIILPLLLRVLKYEQGIGLNDLDGEYRKMIFLRLDSLMYGVLAAYMYICYPDAWFRYRFPALVISLLLLASFPLNPFEWRSAYIPINFVVESIASVFLIQFFSTIKTTRIPFLDAGFIYLGVTAYAMYMVHRTLLLHTLFPQIDHFLGWEGLRPKETWHLRYPLYWGLTFCLSYLLYTFFEEPVTRLRDRLGGKN